VDTARDKPLVYSFLKPSPGRKEEIKFIFDVSKCDKLFDVLLQNKIVRLSEGHVIPSPGQMAKVKYCKWHDAFSHTTNECNYFRRQVQSVLNDGRLTLGDGHKMKLDTDPFLMRTSQTMCQTMDQPSQVKHQIHQYKDPLHRVVQINYGNR
jgi:hypothetical protein